MANEYGTPDEERITVVDFEAGIPEDELDCPDRPPEGVVGGIDFDLEEAMEAVRRLGETTKGLLASKAPAEPDEPRLCVTAEDRRLRLALIRERYAALGLEKKRSRPAKKPSSGKKPEKKEPPAQTRQPSDVPCLEQDGMADIEGLTVGDLRACAAAAKISVQAVRQLVGLGKIRSFAVLDRKGNVSAAYVISDVCGGRPLPLRTNEAAESEIEKRRRQWAAFLARPKQP